MSRVRVGHTASGRVGLVSGGDYFLIGVEAARKMADACDALAAEGVEHAKLRVSASGGDGFIYEGAPAELEHMARHLREQADYARLWIGAGGHA